MTFLSVEFALLFLAFFVLYWLFVRWPRGQNLLLLSAGYALVMSFDGRFAMVMAVFAGLIWGLGRWLAVAVALERPGHARLGWALGFALLPLAVFKYFDFFREQAQTLLFLLGLNALLPALPLLLPIGLSFYSFNAITYLVSVHRRELAPATLPEVALFLSFFPVLTAGPICRASEMWPQIRAARRTPGDPDRILALIVLAIAKKWCLASYLGEAWVNPLFANPGQYHALELACGLYAYALQIYFDFSGYTDLAIALALMLGFAIPENFNAPYLAHNLKEFWQRWHMSLSRWIRDYVYIPLGGNRHGFWATQCCVLVAMLLSGLWHGAGGHFIVWGALHGLGVVALNTWQQLAPAARRSWRLPGLAQFVTLHYVCLAWLFFRAADTAVALDYLLAMRHNLTAPALSLPVFGFLAALLASWFTQPWWARLPRRLRACLAATPAWAKPAWVTWWLAIIAWCSPAGIPGFIYAQF